MYRPVGAGCGTQIVGSDGVPARGCVAVASVFAALRRDKHASALVKAPLLTVHCSLPPVRHSHIIPQSIFSFLLRSFSMCFTRFRMSKHFLILAYFPACLWT
jgi:hypothetical protein